MKLKGPSKAKSPATLECDDLKDAKHTTQLWERRAPTYRVEGVRLKERQERSKNNETDIFTLNKVMELPTNVQANGTMRKEIFSLLLLPIEFLPKVSSSTGLDRTLGDLNFFLRRFSEIQVESEP